MLLVMALMSLTVDYTEIAAVLISSNRLSIISLIKTKLSQYYRYASKDRLDSFQAHVDCFQGF